MRRTKIVCTLGPASSDFATIGALVDAGMDVARLNFSHGDHESHGALIETIRAVSRDRERHVAILQDLQGPKIRIGKIKNGGTLLHEGAKLVLTPEKIEVGKAKRMYISHPTIASDVEVGGRILLDDGRIELKVQEIDGADVVTRVIVGGPIWSKKGVNLPNMQSTASSSLTEKDERDLEFGLENGVDLVALSFVRTERDVAELVQRVRESGKRVGVIAKIEKPEAVTDLDDILAEADAIMVARGDLGIEMPLAQVPLTQKRIVNRCLRLAKPVITATQMLESMTQNPRPTRAEASDVANAVLDGTDAVMLSGETAAGQYPVETVKVMDEIVRSAETEYGRYHQPFSPGDDRPDRLVTNAIAHTATQLAVNVDAKAIACLSHSGATARSIASHRPSVPVFAFTDDARVIGQLAVVWGTKGFHIPFQADTDGGIEKVRSLLLGSGLVESGDRIVVTAGLPLPGMGQSNMVHVARL